MSFWESLGGMTEVRLTSADPSAALRELNRAGIVIYSADRPDDDIVVTFMTRRKDYRRLKALAVRRGYTLSLVKRGGLYWAFKGMLRRPVLVIGIFLIIMLTIFLPTRVYFIRIEGNSMIPTKLILEKCEQCGISFGASRRLVRSEKMKNALLEAIPELQWAGINTSGCVATVSVRERSASEIPRKENGVSSIVAVRDGIITECTVIKGNAVCRIGQAVKAGETLVSGYTDCGISIKATRAEGEIYALTQHVLTAVTPENYQKRTVKTRQEKKYFLIIGKKRINLSKGSGISDTTCDKISLESTLTLPGGFALPVILVTEVWTFYDCSEVSPEEADIVELLREFVGNYLTGQMVAGHILNREESLDSHSGLISLQGKYACLEMIGRVRNEEIVTPDGQ